MFLCGGGGKNELMSQYSLNVETILREKGNRKTQPCDVFSSEVGVYSRRTLMLNVIKVDTR